MLMQDLLSSAPKALPGCLWCPVFAGQARGTEL